MPIRSVARHCPPNAMMLMLASMFCAALMNAAIRALADSMPPAQMVLLRNVVGLCLISAWIVLRKQKGVLRTSRPFSHIWRASIGFCAMELWFYALSIMQLNTATALSFTTPIFGTIFAILILKESAGWRRWLAVIAGFIGVLVILHPGVQSVNMASFIVLVSSALMALSGVTVKSLTKTESPETIVFYMALFMTPFSAPLAMMHWQPVSAHGLALVIVIAGISTAMHLMLARAYRYADMVALLPFDFTRMIFTAAFAYLFFDEMLDHNTVLGVGIIMASSLYIAHRERLRRSQIAKSMLLEPGEL